MRIGLLTAQLHHHNGWSHYGTSLAAALLQQGASLKIVSAHGSPALPGVEVYPLLPDIAPPERGMLARMAWNLPRVRMLLDDCDIIHVTAEYYAPLAAMIAGRRPLFLTIHGSYARLPHIRRWPVGALYGWAFRRSTLLCVSRYTESVVKGIVPQAATAVVNNGVDIERFALAPSIKADKPTILTTGGVKARKGTLQLVQAMAVVRQHVPTAQCVIIGTTTAEPAYTERVHAEIRDLHLEDCVHLAGFVDEETLLHWYGAAHIFVLPAQNISWKFEGFGLVYLEASASGLPVIGTTDCGAVDAIQHDVTGLLVDQAHTVEELPGAILDILANPQRAQMMGAAGKQRAQQFTWDRAAQQILALYGMLDG